MYPLPPLPIHTADGHPAGHHAISIADALADKIAETTGTRPETITFEIENNGPARGNDYHPGNTFVIHAVSGIADQDLSKTLYVAFRSARDAAPEDADSDDDFDDWAGQVVEDFLWDHDDAVNTVIARTPARLCLLTVPVPDPTRPATPTDDERERVRLGLHDGGVCERTYDGCDNRCATLADIWRDGITTPTP